MSGKKDDAGKPRMDLIPAELWDIVDVVERPVHRRGPREIALYAFSELAYTGYTTEKVLLLVATVLTNGAERYGDYNWKQLDRVRIENALLRHLYANMAGTFNDPDSGLPHLVHVLCNCSFLLHLEANAL